MRTAGERVIGHPTTHPRPVDIGVAIITGVPVGAPQSASGSEVVRRGHNEIMTAMSTQSMRAYVLTAPGKGGVQEMPAPVAASGEVVVDFERVGVCAVRTPSAWPAALDSSTSGPKTAFLTSPSTR